MQFREQTPCVRVLLFGPCRVRCPHHQTQRHQQAVIDGRALHERGVIKQRRVRRLPPGVIAERDPDSTCTPCGTRENTRKAGISQPCRQRAERVVLPRLAGPMGVRAVTPLSLRVSTR